MQTPDIRVGYVPISDGGIPDITQAGMMIGTYPISSSSPSLVSPGRYLVCSDIGTNIRVGIYRYRDQMSRYRRVIQFPDHDIAHHDDVSCHGSQPEQAPGPGPGQALAGGWPGLSGCCRLLVIARESFIQCNDLCFIWILESYTPGTCRYVLVPVRTYLYRPVL